MKGLGSIILAHYDEKSQHLLIKKAQFLFWFIIIYSLLMIALPFVYYKTQGIEHAIKVLPFTWAQLPFMVLAILALRARKMRVSANIIGFFSCIVTAAGLFIFPFPRSGVTFAYFQFACVAFSVFFCSYWASALFFAVFVGSHITYYILVSSHLDPSFAAAARSMLTDAPIALALIYISCLSATLMINRALSMMHDDHKRFEEQSEHNQELVGTIKSAAERLASSIDNTHGVITSFTDNAQSQAASMEELSATVEEITAGTENTRKATSEQNESVKNLALSIEHLSGSIEEMQNVGTQIQIVFEDFLSMARDGKESSAKLDKTNKKITQSSNEIISVVTIIEEFFDKIKMLSLNATIEAARAGEFGRGFAVVASEIGKLSDDSTKELSQISTLIENNKHDVESGNEVITEIINFIQILLESAYGVQQKTAAILNEIEKQKSLKDEMNSRTTIVKNNSELIEQSMQEQQRAMDDVSRSIADTNSIVQRNADNTTELENNARNLKNLAMELEKKFS
jgi:methyl-accepting chemotaxis protein